MTLFPLRPNWDSAYIETYSFLTEIITSDSGKEQRRALRLAARHSVEFEAMAVRDAMRLRRQLAPTLANQMVFADEIRVATVDGALETDDTTLTLTTTPSWLATAAHLVLMSAGGAVRATYPIDSVAGPVITLADPLLEDWADGTSVFLGVVGRLDPTQTAAFRTNTITTGSVAWMVEPGNEVQPVSAAPQTFNGREVLIHRPNWAAPIEFETVDPITFIDPGMGVRSAYRREDFIPEGRKSQHLVRSDAHLNQTLGAFLRGRGRQGEFYQPTMTDDLPLMQTIAEGATSFRTPGHGVADAYGDSTVHKAVAVHLLNGDVHLFRVSGLTAAGTTTPYTLVETIEDAPIEITPAMVNMICWMPVVRFASDELSVKWRTNQVAEITMNTVTLEDL